MSYCVNCGVKLKNSEKKCPLCNTKVINPNKIDTEYEPIYSNKVENFKRINYKYLSKIVILILMITAFLILLLDYASSRSITWSLYIVASILYLGTHLSFAVIKNIYISLFIHLISTELFMLFIAYMTNGMHWYLYLVLPFIFIVWIYIMLVTYLIKRKKGEFLKKLSLGLLFSGLTVIAVEACIDLFRYNFINYNWSFYASLPITIISTLTFILSYSKRIVDEIRQRMFF